MHQVDNVWKLRKSCTQARADEQRLLDPALISEQCCIRFFELLKFRLQGTSQKECVQVSEEVLNFLRGLRLVLLLLVGSLVVLFRVA